jgi:hypothetical protein
MEFSPSGNLIAQPRLMFMIMGALMLILQNVVGAQEILKSEPAAGALPAGTTVLVDDGTCPKGQIKQVTGGKRVDGVQRQKKCIKR